jgi:hypothetical protein
MSQQKTAKSPLKWLSLDKEGRASRHEGSFRKFFGTDIDENGNTIEEAGDDQGEARVLEWADLPRSVLKLGNDGELRRSCIVYGDNLEEATVFGQMFLKISQDQQEEVRLRKCLKYDKLDTMEEASQDQEDSQVSECPDIDDKEHTVQKTCQDSEESHVDIPHNILLLDRKQVPRMAHVVYGCHLEEAVAFPEEKGEELSGDRQERRREEIGTRSIPRVSRMHISREVNGQQLISLSTKMPGASSSLNARGHLSATFDAGTNEVEDDDIRCRKLLQSGAPPGSETNWRCEACGVERSVYIQDRAQSRVAYSVTAARMSGRTEGGFLNPFLAPLPRGSQHRRDRRRRPGLPETRSG